VSRPARIGLNALFLDPGVSGGSETYLRALVPELVAGFPDVRFELATTRRGAAALCEEPWAADVSLLALPCDDDEPVRRTLAEQVSLPRLARSRAWDVLHSLSNRAPRWAGTTSVVTIHDVIFFQHQTMGMLSTHGMRWSVRAAAAGADALISVSETAADEIASTLGVARDRIVAVPHGAGRAAQPSPDTALVIERHGIAAGRILLCVAAKRPHKNQELLVDALGRLPDDVMLVLVGHDEGYGAELKARAARLGVADRVRLLEGVSDAELEALWQAASCAAFPTLAEGFGLPVLEAMRRGVPVACSDIPVLHEVGGSAARYFDPADAGDAARAIAASLDDDSAGARGRERAAGFTWRRAAARTFAVYELALERR
jgi:glycosyltransferase involved in cell wall biosynthesis